MQKYSAVVESTDCGWLLQEDKGDGIKLIAWPSNIGIECHGHSNQSMKAQNLRFHIEFVEVAEDVT